MNNRFIFLKNTLIHDNEGAGILLCKTFGANAHIYISNCLLYNNCIRPYNTPYTPSSSYEILSWDFNNTGGITNTTIYKNRALNYMSPTFPLIGNVYSYSLFPDSIL